MKKIIYLGLLLSFTTAFAWDGPVCFPTSTKEVTVSLNEVQGNSITDPSTLVVSYIDNDEDIELKSIQKNKSEGYDLVFTRPTLETGMVGVNISLRGFESSYKYEFEFRSSACSGAVISVK